MVDPVELLPGAVCRSIFLFLLGGKPSFGQGLFGTESYKWIREADDTVSQLFLVSKLWKVTFGCMLEQYVGQVSLDRYRRSEEPNVIPIMRWVCHRKLEVVSFKLHVSDVGFLLYFFENSNTCGLTHVKIPVFVAPEDVTVEQTVEWYDVVSIDQFELHDCIARNCRNIRELEVTVKVLMYSEGKYKNYISYELFSLPYITKVKLDFDFVLRSDAVDNRFPRDMSIRYAVIDRRRDCIDPLLLVGLIGGLQRLRVLNLSGRHFCIWEHKEALWDPPTFVLESQSVEYVEIHFPCECSFEYNCPNLKSISI